jgi:nucleoside-diphosphate-sugar epimerase
MKIAIIGCGYVGSAVAGLWHQAGHQVTVTTTTPEKVTKLKGIASEVAVVEGNDLISLQTIVKNCDVVLLSVGAKKRTIDIYRQAYLETAQNVVAAIQATPGVKQLIYTGSYAILGDQNGELTDETAAVAPANQYGEILWETEKVLLSVPETDFKTCILRLAGIYGSGRELIRIFKGWAGTTRPGEGDDYSNWIHLDDIVRAIDFAREKQLQGIYNLTSNETLQTGEFLGRLFKAHNLPPITWDSSQVSVRPYNTKLSNQKLKNAGFELIHPQIIFS